MLLGRKPTTNKNNPHRAPIVSGDNCSDGKLDVFVVVTYTIVYKLCAGLLRIVYKCKFPYFSLCSFSQCMAQYDFGAVRTEENSQTQQSGTSRLSDAFRSFFLFFIHKKNRNEYSQMAA